MEVTGLSFKGLVCAVVGGGSALGDSIAGLLAGLGTVPVLFSPEIQQTQQQVEQIRLNLSSPRSVMDAAASFKSEFSRCDRLFLSAEIRTLKRELTDDNLDRMFAVNYLGQYLLTDLLFDELRRGAPCKVIVTLGQRPGRKWLNTASVDVQSMQTGAFHPAAQFTKTTMARILFAGELSRRWKRHGITACSVFPGPVIRPQHKVWHRLLPGARAEPDLLEAAACVLELARWDELNGRCFQFRRGVLTELRPTVPEAAADRLWMESEQLIRTQKVKDR